ncbi:MAG TPA: hypothetical protein VID48_09430 [Solirubrobacteraceae bacterium]|jgi:hypothetical protein
MTAREKLHRLVDELSEPDVEEALQYITWQRADGLTRWLRSLPDHETDPPTQELTDPPDDHEQTGRVISFEEIRRRHGSR